MTDRPEPDPRRPGDPADDARDPQVAAWLAVEPLDEVTRARLVRRAVEGAQDDPEVGARPRLTGRDRRWRGVLGAAAALLVVLVVGLVVLVPRGDDADPPLASRAPADSRAPSPGTLEDSTAAAPSGAATADGAEATLVLPGLGELGDVSTQDRLTRVVGSRLRTPFDAAPLTVSGCAAAAGQALGTPLAAGTGTVDGRAAVVIVSEQPAGTTGVVAVTGTSCGRAVSVILP